MDRRTGKQGVTNRLMTTAEYLDPEICDLRLELRTRNNVLWHAIYDLYPSVSEFCRQFDLHQTVVGAFLNLKKSPYTTDGDPKELALRICDATGFGIGHLFPPYLYRRIHPKRRFIAEIPSYRLVSLEAVREQLALPPVQEDLISNRELGDAIKQVLGTITKREREIVIERFGLNHSGEKTQEEVASKRNITKMRVSQIEAKALRKLRHKSRARILKPFVGSWIEEPDARPIESVQPSIMPPSALSKETAHRYQKPSAVIFSSPLDTALVLILVNGVADRRFEMGLVHSMWVAKCWIQAGDIRIGRWSPGDVEPPHDAINPRIVSVRVPTNPRDWS